MKTLVSKINNKLKKIFLENDYDESLAYISISNREELADYQINSCFNIAKSKKKNPMEVADNIASLIEDLEIDGIKAFTSCESCKPGFVNLKLSNEVLFLSIKDIIEDENLGISGQNILPSENKLHSFPQGVYTRGRSRPACRSSSVPPAARPTQSFRAQKKTGRCGRSLYSYRFASL